MQKIDRVHVLRVGDSISADGVETFHSGSDLDQLAKTYDPKIHEAPVVLGHANDTDWSKLLTRNDSFPAEGWITDIYREGNDLYIDLDASDELVEFIKDKKYKKRSLGYYGRNSKNNPKPGELYARHIAFLGAAPPSIKGLEDIKLTEPNNMATDVETKELLDQNAEEWLAFILKDEGGIVRETIVAFDPKPSIENNYLYNLEENKWEGAFITEDEERFLFEIVEQEGEGEAPDFIVTVKADIPENQADAEEAVAADDQEVLDSANTPDTPAEAEARDNLADQESEGPDEINLTEEHKMGKLLKEKTTTEREYAADEEKTNMEYRDDGHADGTEKAHGKPEPKNTDPVADTENRKYAYAKYVEDAKAKGEEPMEEAEFMEMEYGTYTEEPEAEAEAPVEEEEVIAGEGCLGEDCPGQEEKGEYADEEIEIEGEDEVSKIKAMEEELNLLRAKVKAQEEKEMKAREEEMVKFAEGIYDSNKILDSQFKKEDLTELLTNLLHVGNEHMVYGEGENQKNVLDVVKSLVENLPEQVKLSEAAVVSKPKRNAVAYNPNYSKGSQERRAKIIAIMDERGIAHHDMNAYMSINNELTAKEGHYEN